MKLLSWNVNGIRAVLKKELFLTVIEAEKPDIFCLQEIKANEDQIEIELPKYHKIINSAEKKGYSGTAIFSKKAPLSVQKNLPAHIVEKFNIIDDGYGNPNEEGRVIAAEFEDCWVVTVYTPNAKGDLSRLELRHKKWDPAFLAFVKELECQKPVLFCGDLNVAHNEIDLANPKPNIGKHGFTPEEREGFNNFEKAGFIDTLRATFPEKAALYTWWSHWGKARERNVGWRIDYWMVSASLAKKYHNPRIHPELLGSDHCPVSVEVVL